MRKICTLIAVFVVVCFQAVNAQGQPCDTINSPVPGNWTATNYGAPTPFPGFTGGFINGVNFTKDLQKANYFDLSATPYTHILGVVVKFGKANSNFPANLSKLLYFKVYADNAGVPGTQLGSAAQIPLSQANSDVKAGLNTNINFSSAIALPASKKFYVSMDVSNFEWKLQGGNATHDSVSISSTADDQVKPNAAWEFTTDSTWESFTDGWENPSVPGNPLDVTLYIFPYVATSATGCALLPVQLLSFNAVRKANDVVLNWQISSELNMKGYEIEKAYNNNVYTKIVSVAALNSLKNQQYTVTDKNAFAASSTVQYRLKQIDGDGSIKYSRIITLASNNSITDVVFANPFSGALKLQLNLSEPQTLSIKMYDMQGRMVAMQAPSLYSASNNIINLNAAAGLKPGTYLLELNTGKEQKVFNVIKE